MKDLTRREFVVRGAALGAALPLTRVEFELLGAIVEGHGGRLEVESEPGRGTRVTIVMPGHAPETGTDRS